MSAARLILLLTTCALAWTMLFLGILAVGPQLEARYFPPIKDISFSEIERNGSKLCWRMNFRKVRNVAPHAMQYWITHNDDLGREALLVTLNGSTALALAPQPIEADPNKFYMSGRFCAELPISHDGRIICDITPKSVIGSVIQYETHFAWDILINVPPLVVPKIPSDGAENLYQRPRRMELQGVGKQLKM